MRRTLLMLVAILTMILSACGQAATPTDKQQPNQPAQPVTLKVVLTGAYVETFHTYMDPILKEELPNVTLDYLDPSTNLQASVSSGDIPDIIMQNT
ncbi:MAG: hypothetical protein JWN30_2491, partial [Bacilli bacterium]|nr:hypothetical protein [Bacilli bacterium]